MFRRVAAVQGARRSQHRASQRLSRWELVILWFLYILPIQPLRDKKTPAILASTNHISPESRNIYRSRYHPVTNISPDLTRRYVALLDRLSVGPQPLRIQVSELLPAKVAPRLSPPVFSPKEKRVLGTNIRFSPHWTTARNGL